MYMLIFALICLWFAIGLAVAQFVAYGSKE